MYHPVLEKLYYHGLRLKCYGLVSTVSCIFWTIVEQAIRSVIKTSVASSWHFTSTYKQIHYTRNREVKYFYPPVLFACCEQEGE